MNVAQVFHSSGGNKGFPTGLVVKKLPVMQELQETRDQSLGEEDPLEKGMATHSSILAGRIPWREEPDSPWGHKVLDTTEQLTLSLFFSESRVRARPHPSDGRAGQVSLTPHHTLDMEVTPPRMQGHHLAGPLGTGEVLPDPALLPLIARGPVREEQ